MVYRLHLLLLAAACGAVLITAGGCDDEETPPERPISPESALPFADTPDQLMANFKAAYGGLNIDDYRDEVLADAYDFVVQADTEEEFQLPDNVFDRDDELAIAGRMFALQPNLDAHVLSQLDISTFQPQGLWLSVPQADPYFGDVPGALYRRYEVLMYFNMRGDFRYETLGYQVFYVVPDTAMHEGAMTPCYRLRGQLDQTAVIGAKGSDSASWSTVKALWY